VKGIGCQPYAPGAFTPGKTWYSFLEAELTPRHMELSDDTEKNPATPGIDPRTFRLVGFKDIYMLKMTEQVPLYVSQLLKLQFLNV
jgi:hypothetical protein